MASVTIASVIIANVIMANVIMANVLMANVTEPFLIISVSLQIFGYFKL